jgi:2'-5' RNA ligase
VRLFVAVELNEEWRAAALDARARIEARLDAEVQRALRWVAPDLLHVTLRFLGEYPDAELPRLLDALAERVREVELVLELTGVGTFGQGARLRTAWLGLGGDLEQLRRVADAIETAVAGAGAQPSRGGFAPHVTLARVRERTPAEARRRIAPALADVEVHAEPLRVQQVALVRSHLGAGGPRYEVLERLPSGSIRGLSEAGPSAENQV